MYSNFIKRPLLDHLKKIIFFLPLIFIVSCASTERFHYPSIDLTKSDEQLATLHFKRTPVGYASGGSLYVIDYDIKEKSNGVIARMSPSPTPLALLWAPDREKGHGTITLGNRFVVYRMEQREGSTIRYQLPIEKGMPFGLLNFVLKLPVGFNEIELPIEDSEGRVVFKEVTVIGKTANKGTLSWKRPAGKFKLGLVYSNGWYYESPYIEVLSGEVKFVEFELCCGLGIPSDSKFNISNIPFSD